MLVKTVNILLILIFVGQSGENGEFAAYSNQKKPTANDVEYNLDEKKLTKGSSRSKAGTIHSNDQNESFECARPTAAQTPTQKFKTMNSEGAKSNSSSSNRNRDRDRDRDHTSLDDIVPSKAQAKYTAHSGELFAYERLAKEESDEQQQSAINKKLAIYKPIDSNGLKIEEAKKPETVNVVESSRKVMSSETEEDQLKLLQVKKELKR